MTASLWKLFREWGAKTANVVMNTAFGEPTIAVDTHIFRVSNRTGLAPKAKHRFRLSSKLLKVVPDEYIHGCAHHWLILHGRYTPARQENPTVQSVSSETFVSFNFKTQDVIIPAPFASGHLPPRHDELL